MIKIDFHLHTNNDKIDYFIKHSPKILIDRAAKIGLDAISITLHDKFFNTKKIFEYAKKKNILLIPGIEKKIEEKDVLIINVKRDDLKKIKKLEDLKKIKREDVLIIAPHPFLYTYTSLKDQLEKNIKLFDALEIGCTYLSLYNPNKKTIELARKYKIPLIANSDTHVLPQLGLCYTIVDSDKDIISIFNAIRNNKIEPIISDINIIKTIQILKGNFSKENLEMTKNYIKHKIRCLINGKRENKV